MSRRYDSMTTIFTPEGKFFFYKLGRLLQVEYAINNINNAGLCLGVCTTEGKIHLYSCFKLFFTI